MESRRPSAPADIITYRLNNKMVYVTPANNYEVRVRWLSFPFFGLISRIFSSGSPRFCTERVSRRATKSQP